MPPLEVTPFEFRRSLVSENESPWAIMWHCLRNPVFSHFETMLACVRRSEGQTDERTDGHTMTGNTALSQHRTVKMAVKYKNKCGLVFNG